MSGNSNHLLSAVTLDDETVVTATDQILTCKITDVSQVASVTWKNADTPDLSDSVEGYAVSQGTVIDESQESTLTIKAAKLQSLQTSTIFTCVVHSGQHSISSPDVTKTMTLTTLVFGKLLCEMTCVIDR